MIKTLSVQEDKGQFALLSDKLKLLAGILLQPWYASNTASTSTTSASCASWQRKQLRCISSRLKQKLQYQPKFTKMPFNTAASNMTGAHLVAWWLRFRLLMYLQILGAFFSILCISDMLVSAQPCNWALHAGLSSTVNLSASFGAALTLSMRYQARTIMQQK